MRKMLFFFGILSLYEGKEGAHIFPSLFVVLQPYTRKEAKKHLKGRSKSSSLQRKTRILLLPHLLRAHEYNNEL